MADTKQVICMRTDLNMRKGKMVAQGAHASLGIFTRKFNQINSNENKFLIELTGDMVEWLENSYVKICVRVSSEKELLEIYNKAIETNLPACLITDNGLTEFNGVPTKTCIAIGPANSEEIDKITGYLKLL